MTLAPGTRLGPYVIDIPVGAGGMGEVYRARDTRLERDVAIKVLPAGVAGDPDRRARFEREAQGGRGAVASEHPRDPRHRRWHDGVALCRHGAARRRDAARAARRAARCPCARRSISRSRSRAACAAHDKGIVHRDLKPENMFLLERRAGQDSRLRPRAAVGRDRSRDLARRDRRGHDRRRHGDGHGRLHGARAGARQPPSTRAPTCSRSARCSTRC